MERLIDQYHLESQNPSLREWRIFFSELAKDKKADVRILEWAGFLALEKKQWPSAENIFSALLNKRDKVLDLVALAQALRRQSRWDEAKDCYLSALDKLVEPGPLLFIVYKALGDIYLLKNDCPMAEEYYNKAGALNPSNKSLFFYRAMMYLKEKNYAEAERNFQTFISSHFNSAKSWLGLALARKALGDDELALACLKRSLDIDPQNLKALNLKKRWQSNLFDSSLNSLEFSA